jgi:hypothetical protein
MTGIGSPFAARITGVRFAGFTSWSSRPSRDPFRLSRHRSGQKPLKKLAQSEKRPRKVEVAPRKPDIRRAK